MNDISIKCTECGACCMYPFVVGVSDHDKIPEKYLSSDYIMGCRYMERDKKNGFCIVFDQEKRLCRIYNNRPEVCRSVQPNDQWCEKSRAYFNCVK